jgi:hypothetical protein
MQIREIPRGQIQVEPPVKQVVEIPLHEGPLRVPIDLRQEEKPRMWLAHPAGRLRPERLVHRGRAVGRQGPSPPSAFKDFRENKPGPVPAPGGADLLETRKPDAVKALRSCLIDELIGNLGESSRTPQYGGEAPQPHPAVFLL